MRKTKVPNQALRYYRERRNWTQEQAAETLLALCGPGRRGEINARMISRWERGEQVPSLEYREKLCKLYEVQSPEELGFLRQEELSSVSVLQKQSGLSAAHPQQEYPWLTFAVTYLGQLLSNGWSIREVLDALKIVLQSIQDMPTIYRSKLLSVNAAPSVSSPLFISSSFSEDECIQFCSSLERSIDAGWQLFHTASNIQVLTVGQTLLYLLQQSHMLLPPRKRNKLYCCVQNLIGKALYFQGRYEEAMEAHVNAHIAALGSGDPSEVARCLFCQADVYQALGQYSKSIGAIEEALCFLNNPASEMFNRLKAHILAGWADNAMSMGEFMVAQQKLSESRVLLNDIAPNEEFDLASWFQLSGKYAFMLQEYQTAIQEYEKALTSLPSNWFMRQVFVLLQLLSAYTCVQNREGCLTTIERLVTVVQLLNAPIINKYFMDTVQGVRIVFEKDVPIQDFVAQKLRHIA